ncbi:hypothetical protein H696_04955 [Fonticula alba]|uniref:Calponin-homology (CH) domain-containing protein n=1 Tax=Fonticula alba TaxID=691883 RepID=A0A058Z2Z2_FONAL|nr:hypothetical protein H696_04955 [Fonticula alba]KCV68664.1 hypothetical protein H696_04955 [Fonticula alba]|eukprot:XP_009497096.1 hypothetical protein H696_04955 [Fonticula alba]
MVQLESGSFFRSEDSEFEAIVDELNDILALDRDLKQLLPLKTDNLIDVCRDGAVLARFINLVRPGTVDLSKLRGGIDIVALKKMKEQSSKRSSTSSSGGSFNGVQNVGSKNIFEATTNANLALEGLNKLGVPLVNAGPMDIVHGNRKIIMGILWQVMRVFLLHTVCVNDHPELVLLMNKQETLQEFNDLPPEALLLRWVNYHLRRGGGYANGGREEAGTDRRITNFTEDLADGMVLLRLLNALAPRQVGRDMVQEAIDAEDDTARHRVLLRAAAAVDCRKHLSSDTLKSKRRELNLAFLAQVFNKFIGMRLWTEDEVDDLMTTVDRLKAKIIEAGVNDEGRINSIVSKATDALAEVTLRMQQLETQTKRDAEIIDKHESLAVESQLTIDNLRAELQQLRRTNQEMVEFHNRQVEKIHKIQDRNRNAHGPAAGSGVMSGDELFSDEDEGGRSHRRRAGGKSSKSGRSKKSSSKRRGSSTRAGDDDDPTAMDAGMGDGPDADTATGRRSTDEIITPEIVEALVQLERAMRARIELVSRGEDGYIENEEDVEAILQESGQHLPPVGAPVAAAAANAAAGRKMPTDSASPMLDTSSSASFGFGGMVAGGAGSEVVLGPSQTAQQLAQSSVRACSDEAVCSAPIPERLHLIGADFVALFDILALDSRDLRTTHARISKINDILFKKVRDIAEQYSQGTSGCRGCGRSCKKCTSASSKSVSASNSAVQSPSNKNAWFG